MATIPPIVAERPFDQTELEQRLERTRADMSRLGIDLLLVTDQDDIFYLTTAREIGGLMLAALLVPRTGDPAFIGRAVDMVAVEAYSGITNTYPYWDYEVPEEKVADALRSYGIASPSIGFQGGSPSLPVASLEALKRLVPEASWEDSTRIVWDQRMIKSPRELEHQRAAAAINTHALDRAIAAIRPGVSDSVIAAELFAGMVEAGSHPMSYFILVSGPNTGVVHATYANRLLEENDHVHFEFSAARFRYHAPLMRTVTLGKPSEKVELLHEAAQAAVEAAMSTIRTGVTSGEVDAAANAVLEDFGVRQWHYHRTGYSVGVATGGMWPEGHVVAIRGNDPTVLQENMVFHLPMVLFEPGVAGAGISETIRVTETGAEPITSYRRELIRL
jgi:Xaa-Pro dipeptidase